MSFTCLRIEGGLLSPDFLDRIHEMQGQKPADFGLPPRRSLVDEVSAAYAEARVFWNGFQLRLKRSKGESATTVTRDQWVIPLLELLGYNLTFQRKAADVDGRTYALSHRAGTEEDAPPVHIVSSDQELGSRPPSGRGNLSPHALVQDYLNRTDHAWGLVTNGLVLRLLRDSSYLTRSAYIEFDLEQMMEGERLDEFILFFRLAHRTRLPQGSQDASKCLLEDYYQHALEQGGRIRDGLREAVEQAIRTLANGFLNHPRNESLRQKIRDGKLTASSFYHDLLYVVYRLLFLFVAEERDLLVASRGSSPELYRFYFSLTRLRTLADEPLSAPERFDDLYLGLRSLFYILGDEKLAERLGLTALNGKLFQLDRDIDAALLCNRDLLAAIAAMSYFTPKDEQVRRRVNYGALDVEELGSVYESLLDLQPLLEDHGGKLVFNFGLGTERKTTGSYYTRPELVGELITSALVPVMDERLKAARTKQDKEKALVSLKVCDPACGSGHFLLAAARRIGRELARIRTDSDEPAPETAREAIRDVITHCIYGVDKNPLAVDLCMVALWIEGHARGKPLTFLKNRIRCGDSLVGVLDLAVLKQGIPDEAFEPVTGDDKPLARQLKKQNKEERKHDYDELDFSDEAEVQAFAVDHKKLLELPDDTPEHVRQKDSAYHRLHDEGTKWWDDSTACNLWTAAFFVDLNKENLQNIRVPTSRDLRRFLEGQKPDGRLMANAWALAHRLDFFHWPLEFPEVFASGGFDVILCNPPWERINLQEKEFFCTTAPEIARAANKAARSKLIDKLAETRPGIWSRYQQALHDAATQDKFLRHSRRYPHTSRGDINTYAVFAELIRQLLAERGRAGVILPIGIATDETTRIFFGDLIDKQALGQLVGFENEAFIFPAVHHSFKFCALTMKAGQSEAASMPFVFFCRYFQDLHQTERQFELSASDFGLLNPNTRTCPIFRTRFDAELTKKIYRRCPVLINESTGENPWKVNLTRMFHMADDSSLFRTKDELASGGYSLAGNYFQKESEVWLPLYEAKMVHQFDHRFATHEGASQANLNAGILPQSSLEKKQDYGYSVLPRYWLPRHEVNEWLENRSAKWLLGFRAITSAVTERTAIFSLLPIVGAGHSLLFVFLEDVASKLLSTIFANLNSLVNDYVTRQKIGGANFSFHVLRQIPILPPSSYSPADVDFIAPRVLELVYTAWDLEPFAKDMGYSGEPFRWDENRRATLRAELDAYYARLYGLTRDELRYILDPHDVHGPDFPGETFRVLKDNETRKFGEYRTRRLVMEAWDKMK